MIYNGKNYGTMAKKTMVLRQKKPQWYYGKKTMVLRQKNPMVLWQKTMFLWEKTITALSAWNQGDKIGVPENGSHTCL